MTARATEQPVVSREKHVNCAALRAGQVQRIKRAKTKLLEFQGPNGILSLGTNHLAGEHEQRIHIVAAFRIGIPANLEVQDGAADPSRTLALYQSQDLLDGPRLPRAPSAGFDRPPGGSDNMRPSRSSNTHLRVPFIGSNDFTEWWSSAVARQGLKI